MKAPRPLDRVRSRRATSLTTTLMAIIALSSMAALFVSASGYLAARRERASASETLVLRRAQADELVLLRRATATLPRSSGDLASRMTAVLASCGLPSQSLGSVLPEPPVELPSAGGVHRTRQVARVSLEKLTLPTLGRILDIWRSAEPAWAITAIDLSAAPVTKALAPSEDRQLRLRATLTLEAVFSDSVTFTKQNPSPQATLIGGGT
ncbi:MAG: hypothetical protein JNL50_14930 [Phycisphaerae bacterium]|nr:hypothetical protein [Phycisphaerae bacterium]